MTVFKHNTRTKRSTRKAIHQRSPSSQLVIPAQRIIPRKIRPSIPRTTSLRVISWNVRRLRANNNEHHIAETLRELSPAYTPTFIVLYENKTKPETVAENILSQIADKGTLSEAAGYILRQLNQASTEEWTAGWLPCGGSTHTAENILYFCRDCTASAQSVSIADRLNKFLDNHKNNARAKAENSARRMESMEVTTRLMKARKDSLSQMEEYISEQTAFNTRMRLEVDWYRYPVYFEVTTSDARTAQIYALHAPGPQFMSHELFEEVYLAAVCDNARPDLFIGDFNTEIKSIYMHPAYILHKAIFTGGTTQNLHGQHGTRKYDQALTLTSGVRAILSWPDHRVSDHAALIYDIRMPRIQQFL